MWVLYNFITCCCMFDINFIILPCNTISCCISILNLSIYEGILCIFMMNRYMRSLFNFYCIMSNFFLRFDSFNFCWFINLFRFMNFNIRVDFCTLIDLQNFNISFLGIFVNVLAYFSLNRRFLGVYGYSFWCIRSTTLLMSMSGRKKISLFRDILVWFEWCIDRINWFLLILMRNLWIWRADRS